MTMFKKAYGKAGLWMYGLNTRTLDSWTFGRLDTWTLDDWMLGLWTLRRLDSGPLEPGNSFHF